MASPCIKVCQYDAKTGWCLGCGMTKADRRAWKHQAARREGIRAELPARLATLAGIGHVIGKAAKRRHG